MDLTKLKGLIPGNVMAILPEGFAKYQINNELRAAHFLAQSAHESGNFTLKTESTYYSSPERIVKIWPTRFNLDGSGGLRNAHEYTKNPEKLAEVAYGGRADLGNDQPGDGYRFRGAGYMQATGKAKYKEYAKYLGKTVGETADLMRSVDHYALDSALWVFATDKKLNPVADTGPGDDVITRVTKIINGGLHGLAERKVNFRKFYSALTK